MLESIPEADSDRKHNHKEFQPTIKSLTRGPGTPEKLQPVEER